MDMKTTWKTTAGLAGAFALGAGACTGGGAGDSAPIGDRADGVEGGEFCTNFARERGAVEVDEDIRFHSLAVKGESAYAGTWDDGLCLFDVASERRPESRGCAEMPDSVRGLEIEGDRLYASVMRDGLWIMDIADPINPDKIGKLDYEDVEEGWLGHLEVEGDIAYVAGAQGGLLVVDVADPAHPELLGSTGTEFFTFENSVVDVSVSGDVVYIAREYEGVAAVDVSDPAAPEIAGEVEFRSGSNNLPREIVRVEAHGDRVYSSFADSAPVAVVDATDPTALEIEDWGRDFTAMGTHDLTLAGDVAAAGCRDQELCLFDVSGETPELVRETSAQGRVQAVDVHGDSLYYVSDNTWSGEKAGLGVVQGRCR